MTEHKGSEYNTILVQMTTASGKPAFVYAQDPRFSFFGNQHVGKVVPNIYVGANHYAADAFLNRYLLNEDGKFFVKNDADGWFSATDTPPQENLLVKQQETKWNPWIVSTVFLGIFLLGSLASSTKQSKEFDQFHSQRKTR